MAGTSPFDITLKRNVQAGYGPITICVYCVSDRAGAIAEYYNSWRIEQYMDCGEALVIKTDIPTTNTVTAYSATATTLTYVSEWSQIFTIVG